MTENNDVVRRSKRADRIGMVSIGTLAREIVIRAIVNCDDPEDRKVRILIAREHALINAEDAETLIKIYELEEA